MTSTFRIGQGMDVHKFEAGRELWLGGVQIPFEKGLIGHSDADALLHAIVDALLGAVGQGDIGTWFPNTDTRWKDCRSSEFLKQVWSKIKQDGWSVVNLDCTLLLEAPKISPFVAAMREGIAHILEISPSRVSIKATTTEGLGFPGRGEGLLASCVVMIKKE